jgi:hypothetical protein
VQFNAPFIDVRDLLKLRVERLQLVSIIENGWQNVIQGHDPENLCSQSDNFALRGRSMTYALPITWQSRT